MMLRRDAGRPSAGGRRRTGAVAALVAAGLLAVTALAGCSQGGDGAGSSSSSSASGPDFAIDQDFADPSVLVDGDTAYAFATNTPGFTVPTATSKNMTSWKLTGADALPELPGWVRPGKTWAPTVARVGDGRFVMYITATDDTSGRQCIGTVVSSTPGGPYQPPSGASGTAPLVCPVAAGGAIDASTFRDDDGRLFLVWKTDGNCCGLDTWIESAPLSADGLTLAGPASKLMKQTRSWQGALVEAPVLVKRAGTYVLFYSANDYSTDRYAIGTAVSPTMAGPYTASTSPFLSSQSSTGRYIGPGGQDIVTFKGKEWLVFHSWDEAYSYRGMVVRPLSWNGATPTLG